MLNDLSLFHEHIDLDPSLHKMSLNSKYNMVINIYKNSTDFCEAFKNGARHILFFSQNFENLNINTFRCMVRKYRGLFRYMPSRSDVDKKYMLFLYIRLMKTSINMTKKDFFIKIFEMNELNDFWLFYYFFGRSFAVEEDYENLKMVIDKAKNELGEIFLKNEKLIKLEEYLLNNLKSPSVQSYSQDVISIG